MPNLLIAFALLNRLFLPAEECLNFFALDFSLLLFCLYYLLAFFLAKRAAEPVFNLSILISSRFEAGSTAGTTAGTTAGIIAGTTAGTTASTIGVTRPNAIKSSSNEVRTCVFFRSEEHTSE